MIHNTTKITIITGNILKYSKLDSHVELGDIIEIDTKTLTKGSHTIVKCDCDICGITKEMMYKTYISLIKSDIDNKYYCHKCSFQKSKNTMIEKYGVEHACQNKDIMNKVKETNMLKYGVSVASKLEETENKKKLSNVERYGVEQPQQNEIIRQKTNETMLERYGVKSPIQNEKIKTQINETTFRKYGVENVFKSSIIRDKITKTTNDNTIKKYKEIINITKITETNYECLCEKNHHFTIYKSLLNQRIKYNVKLCTVCNPIDSQNSDSENKTLNFIKENYDGDIILNSRNIISPLELDIYLPDLKLAFEFNGLYWHNELYKDKNYHLNKTESCLEKDIQLIHIWEDDWTNKQEIVKSMILNKLNRTPNKIYGRKCIIKEVDNNKLIKSFLNKNHIQGFVGSSIKLGLYYENELVSLMTFGKKRNFMNSKSNIGEYELLRFCNKLNTNVVGGASKLFRHFTKNYSFTEITTYADRSHSQGKLYETLGFKFISKTQPNYYYVIDGIRHHRFGFRKDVLVKDGFDPSKTEHEIMIDRKIYKIYDSGSLKYILKYFL